MCKLVEVVQHLFATETSKIFITEVTVHSKQNLLERVKYCIIYLLSGAHNMLKYTIH